MLHRNRMKMTCKDELIAIIEPPQEIVAVVEKGEVIYQSDDDLPDLLTIYELAKI